MPTCWVARCHSTALAWLAPRSPTSDFHPSCCAVWPCSRVRRGCLGIWLKNYAAPSRPPSTLPLTGTLSIGQTPATRPQNSASPPYRATYNVGRLGPKEEEGVTTLPAKAESFWHQPEASALTGASRATHRAPPHVSARRLDPSPRSEPCRPSEEGAASLP